MTQNETLSSRQAGFVEAMLAHATITQAAEACHISRSTAHRWLQDDYIKSEYRARLKELHQSNLDLLIKSERHAISTLLRMMEARSELVRVQAASKLLDLAGDVYKIAEIETIIGELKERLPHGQLRRIN